MRYQHPEDRTDLWEANPSLAAKLAFLEIVAIWEKQTEDGIFPGLPGTQTAASIKKTERLCPVREEARFHIIPDSLKVA